jgi:hypothetical protein
MDLALLAKRSRYNLTAIVMHIVWLVSWFFLSLPVIWIWRQWSGYRQKALSSVFGKERDDPDAERVLQLFTEAAPGQRPERLWSKCNGGGIDVITNQTMSLKP